MLEEIRRLKRWRKVVDDMADEGEYEPPETDADVANDEWLRKNYLELIQDYPNRWIAVLDQKVICSGNRRGGVEQEAREIAGGREFSVYFIEPSGILP